MFSFSSASAKAGAPAISREFSRASELGWLGHFEAAAREYDFPVEVLLALASRESGMRNIRIGDGYGVMQVHYSDDPAWCRSGKWRKPAESIRRGAALLATKRREIQSAEGGSRFIRSHGKVYRFSGAPLDQKDLMRVTLASYSSGMWAYYHFSHGRDPDRSTYQRNYSHDVLARAIPFQEQVALAAALREGSPVATLPPASPSPGTLLMRTQDIAPAPRHDDEPVVEPDAVPPTTNDPPIIPSGKRKTPEQLELELFRQSL